MLAFAEDIAFWVGGQSSSILVNKYSKEDVVGGYSILLFGSRALLWLQHQQSQKQKSLCGRILVIIPTNAPDNESLLESM